MAAMQGRETPMSRARLTPKPCLVGMLGGGGVHRTPLQLTRRNHVREAQPLTVNAMNPDCVTLNVGRPFLGATCSRRIMSTRVRLLFVGI